MYCKGVPGQQEGMECQRNTLYLGMLLSAERQESRESWEGRQGGATVGVSGMGTPPGNARAGPSRRALWGASPLPSHFTSVAEAAHRDYILRTPPT